MLLFSARGHTAALSSAKNSRKGGERDREKTIGWFHTGGTARLGAVRGDSSSPQVSQKTLLMHKDQSFHQHNKHVMQGACKHHTHTYT